MRSRVAIAVLSWVAASCGGHAGARTDGPAGASSDGAAPSDARSDATDAGDDGGTTAGLPATMFSLTIAKLGATDIPSVPFGGIRLWDTSAVWPNLNPVAGTYDFADLDAWLAEAQATGADVVFTFGRTPGWASSDKLAPCTYGSGCAAPPTDVADGDTILKDFTTALVTHSLASTTAHIKYYEIWNEPDLSGTWCGVPGDCSNPDALVTMGKDITDIVHRLDPSARVIGPSPSTGNQFGIHFLPAYYAAGGAPNQDIVGMHGYLYDGEVFATVPEGIDDTIAQLRLLMTANGVGELPIFFTEGAWGGAPNNAAMSDDAKVAYLARDYLLMWKNGIARFYWYAWDTSTFGTLFTSAIQPAGTAYGLIEHWLVGSTHEPSNCAQNGIATWTCTLVLASGAPAQILWNATATHTQSVPANFLQYFTVDDASAHAIVNGVVTVGAKPILIAPAGAVLLDLGSLRGS